MLTKFPFCSIKSAVSFPPGIPSMDRLPMIPTTRSCIAFSSNGGGPPPVFKDSRRCWEAFFFVSLVYEDHFFLISSTVRVWAEELQELILSQILSQALFFAALVTTFDSLLNIMSLFFSTSSKRVCISALEKFGLLFLLMTETIMQFTKRVELVWSVWAPRGKINN